MILCAECQRQNTLDGDFCRGCGHILDPQSLADERIKNEELVTEGFKLLAGGRYEEGLLVAEEVLANDPGNIQAHSLRGDCLERKGDLFGAVQAYEKVMQLCPDSALDRIKLTHIRNVISEKTQVVPKPNRRLAVLGALSAFGLVACVGSIAAILVNDRTNGNKGQNPVTTNTAIEQPVVLPKDPTATDTKQDPVKQPNLTNTNSAEKQEPSQDLTSVAQRPSTTNPNAGRTNSMSGSLPDPRTNAESTVRPVQPNTSIVPINPGAEVKPPANTNNDPDPSPTNIKPENTARPVIDVRPSPGGINSAPPKTNVSELLKDARDNMLAGKLSEAIKSFEQALAQGADPGINNQHLASCYERSGRKSDAIRAYERAISTYNSRIAAGDDSARTKNALDACKQAVANLRG